MDQLGLQVTLLLHTIMDLALSGKFMRQSSQSSVAHCQRSQPK